MSGPRSTLALIAASALWMAGCGTAGSGGGATVGSTGGNSPPGHPRGSASNLPPAGAQSSELARLTALGRPIYCAGRRGNMVALTFDDGPGPYTALALRKLRKHGARATFFVVGKELARGPGLPRRERELGAVGDHTWTHPLLTALPASTVQDELAHTQRAVAQASGAPVVLFRPPYGARNPSVDAIAQRLGLLEIIWDVDSRDSEGASYAGIAQNVISGLVPGSIILMHENRGQTIRALLTILPELARRHLRAVSVPELLAADPPSASQLREGPQGCNLIARGPGG